jgi:hypothetical protein
VPRAVALLVTTLSVAAALPSGATAAVPAGNLTTNPSFETDVSGWGSYNGAVTRVANQADAPDGTAVARVTSAPGNTDDYTLDDQPTTVPSASGGRRYTATAWVRAGSTSAVGKRVTAVIRATSAAGATATCATSEATVLSTTFQLLTASCEAERSGDRLEVYVARQDDVAEGESFLADAVALVAPPQASIPTGNLTTNPSFESGAAGWNGFQSSRSVVTPADGDAPVGTKVVRVAPQAGVTDSYSIDDTPATVATSAAGAYVYTASAWVRGTPQNAGRTVKIALREADAAGTAWLQEQSASVVLSADRYKRVTVSMTAQRTGSTVDLYVARPGDLAAGEAFFADAITLTRTAPATIPADNRVTNPSFTNGTTNWTSFQGTVSALGGQQDAPDGSAVVKVVAGATRDYDSVTLDDSDPAIPSSTEGRTYAASAWAKAAAPTALGGPAKTAYLIIRETTADGTEIGRGQSQPVVLTDTTYRQLTAHYVPTRAGSRIDVFLDRRGQVTTGEAFYADAVTLTESPIASVFGSATTLRPDRARPAGGTAGATLAAARNESASFQVDLRTTGVPLAGLRGALMGPLAGPGGATLANSAVRLSRQSSYDVVTPTDGEGDVGRWPDRLVPDRDPLIGGDGGAFPFDLAARDAAALWADVDVPPTATPGVYTGALRLSTSTGRLVDVPIELTVRPFTLPATSSLRSLFILNPYNVCGASRSGGDGGFADIRSAGGGGCAPGKEQTWRVFSRFAQLGLRNRISIANPYPTQLMQAPSASAAVVPSPARTGAPTNEAAAFATHVKPLLDGTASIGSLPGAQLSTLTTQWPCIRELGAGCLAGWRSFLDASAPTASARMLPWVCDEPAYDDGMHYTPWRYIREPEPSGPLVPDLRTPAADDDGPMSCAYARKTARDGWPGVPVKITTTITDPGLYGSPTASPTPSTLGTAAVNVLAPLVNDLATRETGDERPAYDAFADRAGAEVWGYVSCASGGCDPGAAPGSPFLADPRHDGWPSYSIDQPASQASAMGWMAFLYRLDGESYFDVASGFNEGPGFQHGIDVFGTNGDGQLFYPGRVRTSAGALEDIPFESIRLKRIREGREDYEYLRRLEVCGQRPAALGVAQGLFGDLDHAMFRTTVSEGRLETARRELAGLIVSKGC